VLGPKRPWIILARVRAYAVPHFLPLFSPPFCSHFCFSFLACSLHLISSSRFRPNVRAHSRRTFPVVTLTDRCARCILAMAESNRNRHYWQKA
jgi:hypothetical protein